MSQTKPLRPKSRDEFDIAIICALSFEADAVLALFDHHWDEDECGVSFGKARGDPNAYSTGVLGQHNVVLAHLPNMGKVAAGTIAAFCRMSYPNISLALVVGICGGAPFHGNKKEEIVLGDVIISTGVVQYDLGRRFPNNFEIKDTLDDSLGRPGLEVRNLLSKLKTKRQQDKLQTATRGYIHEVLQETGKPADFPERSQDIVFPADYRHKHQEPSACAICAACVSRSDPVCENALRSTCQELKCDLQQRLIRTRVEAVAKDHAKELDKEIPLPFVHFGRFASGDMVMKSGEDRDHLTLSKDAIGFEMESAGVWDVFPCIIIKSVSDYADSHKNDNWQGYAAASAAGCTKAFLRYWYSARHEFQSETEEKTLVEQLIKSLCFPEMNGRKNSLRPEAPLTLQWIFDDDQEDSQRQSYSSDHDGLEEDPNREGERSLDEVVENDSEQSPSVKLSDTQDENPHRDFEQASNATESPRHNPFDSDDDDTFAGLSVSEIEWDSVTDWLVSDAPVYWISGNPGSGKSTLMKYLLEHPKTSECLAKWRIDTILLSHFFWKPGTQMQQSFKGLLCSLLYDLLSKDPEPFHKARDMCMKTRRLSTSDWSQNELRSILLEYCQESSRPICLFVDGLDEALPGRDVLEIVQFLKSLASCANVKVCISSRPERFFRLHFESCPNLRMHELTKLDIAKYSEGAMTESTLLDPQDQKISSLARQIAELSDGIFLWAVLATQSLIRGINNGDSKEQTSRRLESMPQDLMDLYRDILSRSAADRPIYQKYVTLILNLVLVSSWGDSKYSPMTIFVLTMAMNSDLLERYVVRGDAVKKSELESKVKSVKDTVEAAFAGLLEVKHSDESALEEVIFPHRSVKDFLLDTTEGQNLWQPCDVPREELWARHFKSLLADGRLYSEDPDCGLTSGVIIRYLLRDIFDWEQQRGIPREIIVSYLELARVSFLRGHLCHTPHLSPDLKPRCIEGEFLSHVVYGYKNHYVSYLLENQHSYDDWQSAGG
ncbi:hypothetical protein FGADI_9453 [Fusarium gaditjirri]|uniref:Nucleoside phosphorylase domain-containing protein n=1 Tax=Fusarium gaditjirri TaxID=282569 RepID=A0A8H4WS20_9HYPO|nr:hypothetical protein FGADI_9453 [Fusarium gaditjirri]